MTLACRPVYLTVNCMYDLGVCVCGDREIPASDINTHVPPNFKSNPANTSSSVQNPVWMEQKH